MGRLVDWKSVDLLLISFAEVLAKVPARLTIIGDGLERSALSEQARELGLINGIDGRGEPTSTEDAVHFLGWLPQKECAKILSGADALVLPSLIECGGAVVLEAMALGKPVIATNWGGPSDYLDSSCGILVEPTGKAALISGFAKAMLDLAHDPQLGTMMGACGLEKVRQEYDWEVKVDRMVAIYNDVKANAFERSSPR